MDKAAAAAVLRTPQLSGSNEPSPPSTPSLVCILRCAGASHSIRSLSVWSLLSWLCWAVSSLPSMSTARKRRRLAEPPSEVAAEGGSPPSTSSGDADVDAPIPAYAPHAGDAEAAVDLRGRPLLPSTVAYLRELQGKVEELEEAQQRETQRGRGEGEEVEDAAGGSVLQAELALLVSAGVAELRGVEYRALVNRQGSRAVERWLPHLTPAQLSTLLQAVTPTAFHLLTDRNASHPLERLLQRLPPLLVAEASESSCASPSSLSSALLRLCQALALPPSTEALSSSTFSTSPSSHWPLLLCNESSSHCMRSLILVLTGQMDVQRALQPHPSTTASPPSVTSSSPPSFLVVAPSGNVAPSSVSPLFDGVLASLVSSIAELSDADRVELAFHTSASPALQLLITALASHSTYHSSLRHLIASLTLSSTPSADAAAATTVDIASPSLPWALSSAGASHLRELSRHRVGSHLVEVVLACSAAVWCEGFDELVRVALLPELDQLARHCWANHVVQRLLAVASNRHRRTLHRCNKALRTHIRAYFGQCPSSIGASTPQLSHSGVPTAQQRAGLCTSCCLPLAPPLTSCPLRFALLFRPLCCLCLRWRSRRCCLAPPAGHCLAVRAEQAEDARRPARRPPVQRRRAAAPPPHRPATSDGHRHRLHPVHPWPLWCELLR